MSRHTALAADAADWPDPVEVVNENGGSPVVLLCEHASNHLPAEYGRLGLSEADLVRHIAWDIGAADVTRGLAARLDAPAFLGAYSRLLVDLNRPFEAPTAMPVRSEATDIPGNVGLTEGERRRRRALVFDPFQARVAAHLDRRTDCGRRTVIVTIHSFTPVFLGRVRPWDAGVLFDASATLAGALITRLSADGTLNVAANEPYRIDRDSDYAVPVFGTDRGHDAVLVEIRNDHLSTPEGIAAWIDRLADAVPQAIDAAGGGTVAKT